MEVIEGGRGAVFVGRPRPAAAAAGGDDARGSRSIQLELCINLVILLHGAVSH
jgi:hypothetical protein